MPNFFFFNFANGFRDANIRPVTSGSLRGKSFKIKKIYIFLQLIIGFVFKQVKTQAFKLATNGAQLYYSDRNNTGGSCSMNGT